MRKIRIGDFVTIPLDESKSSFHSYFSATIPPELIFHGVTMIRAEEYNKKGCAVIASHDEYFIIKVPTETVGDIGVVYDSDHRIGKYTQIGFLKKDVSLFIKNEDRLRVLFKELINK
jgi:hypothetical protein